MGRKSFPTGGGHRQWGDVGQIYNTQLGAASLQIFGLPLYAQCRRVKSIMGADTGEATRRRREATGAREVWLIAS